MLICVYVIVHVFLYINKHSESGEREGSYIVTEHRNREFGLLCWSPCVCFIRYQQCDGEQVTTLFYDSDSLSMN
jgi:hypothetical protein